MYNLVYHNVKIEKYEHTNQIVIRGEVTNNSGRSYAGVAVRLVLFKRNVTIANVVFTVNGLFTGTNKEFEKIVEDLEYDQVASEITRYEIYTESAY